MQIQTGFSGAFADITPSGIEAVPRLKHIAGMRGFIIGGNVPSDRALFKWSALNKYDLWDVTVEQAGQQALPRGGEIKKVLGGEYGVIVCEASIYRVNYIGDPEIVFQISEVIPGHGTSASGSVVQWGNLIYFLDTDGFHVQVHGQRWKNQS